MEFFFTKVSCDLFKKGFITDSFGWILRNFSGNVFVYLQVYISVSFMAS